MDLFYDPGFDPDNPLLSKEESHHCLRVLRNKIGDEVKVTNGNGVIWEGVIEEVVKKLCRIEVDLEILTKPPAVRRSIAISPTKQSERFEWFLEKATELGVSDIYPVECRYSERKNINSERALKKMISALKQSHNPFLPKLHPIVSFQRFLSQAGVYTTRLLGNISDHPHDPEIKDGEDAIFLIGPEGGFTDEEIQLAIESGFQEVLLGRYILRTETAGIVAVQYLFNNV